MESSKAAMKEVLSFVDDLKEAVSTKIDISAEFDDICICGMGGSAIGGDIIKDMAADLSGTQISVIRGFDMPGWVKKNTLVIVSSYSGNTRETLSLYDQAMGRGCRIVAISSGGKLAERCEKDGNDIIKVRKGVQPRNALGYVLGYMANITESIGASKNNTEMKRLIPLLRDLRDEIGPDNPDSYAKSIAAEMHGTVPVIYSTAGIAASAMRWKQQINENSKMLAFCGAIPEFNHNEIMGWSGPGTHGCVPVILYEKNESDTMKAIARMSIDALVGLGAEPIVVSIPGTTLTERSLSAVMIGDYVSIYLASMNGVDPLDIGPIASFKQRMPDLFDRR